MSPDNPHNRDLSARLADLIAANNIDAIMDQQPVRWRSATLRVHFEVDVANLGELDLDMGLRDAETWFAARERPAFLRTPDLP